MTRKTQIGLLTAACVLCCAGVFLGARLSNRSHAAADSTPMTIEPPEPPTPIIADGSSSKPVMESKDKPTMVAVEETPPSPPDIPMPDQVETTKGKKAPAPVPDDRNDNGLPAISPDPDRETAPPAPKPMPDTEVVAVKAEEPASNAKADTSPPPPLPPVGGIDAPPPRAVNQDALPKREVSAPPALPGRDVPVKPVSTPPDASTIPPSKAAPPPDEPPPSSSAPPAIVPPPVRPPTPEPPVSTSPMPVDPLTSVNPRIAQPDRDPPPPARVVPVSPTTPETVKVTPVIKKPSGKSKVLPITGTHACKIDGDHGLTLPKEARDQIGEQDVLFVTLGTDHAVWITTAAGLEKLADRLEKTPDVDDESKVMRRRYLAQTERVVLDKLGHFVLPSALANSAGLKQDAVLIGVGDHLELWDAQHWQKVSQTTPAGETPDSPAADTDRPY